ncbi:MAG TPA: BON domain-containing protein [Pyrinomonadaceae bacterium]|jgi:hyperosmotically inducible protein|nr:BON domain-containing protein [Pyrinomonadaceae bacterium]
MKTFKQNLIAIIATMAIASIAAVAAPNASQTASGTSQQVIKQVRHELVTLPYYGVFDNLAYEVNGGTVTLSGQVTRPTTRSDAGRRVAKIAGVQKVVNNIEVLPLSSFDDSIRLRTYRAVFNAAGLYRYGMGANPSIHIIVNRGQLTLEGVVSNKMDKQLAYMAASRVFGAFSVTNNLRVENDENQAS